MREDSDDDRPSAFPRLESRSAAGAVPFSRPDGADHPDEVFFSVHQHRGRLNANGYEVHKTADGASEEIPLSVSATTVGSWVRREVVLRSPWLTRCLEAPEGATLRRSFGGHEDASVGEAADGDLDAGTGGCDPRTCVTCLRPAPQAIELGIPVQGAGKKLLSPSGALQCLDLVAAHAAPFDAFAVSAATLLGFFLWATILELDSVAAICREALASAVDPSTVALALAAGHATGDAELLRRCYWCLRGVMCGGTGVPRAWIEGRGPVRLSRGGQLSHGDACSTPLRVLASVVEKDMLAKSARWHVPTDCYTLCQVHRVRSEGGSYPHTYELRLDHSDEVVMRALREDERSAVRVFGRDVPLERLAETSEHCEDYLGCVMPNFWGTTFVVYDNGADVDALNSRSPEATMLPLRPRSELCTIGYTANLLGDCPRKVSVEFERDGTRHRFENIEPRWDKKLNSYALPFFGRVKKASAKNFQLVVNKDPNTIFLMFGKISKDVFCLDYRGPIAALDAMGIAIAAMAKKRAVS